MSAQDRQACVDFAYRAALGAALALIVFIAVTGVIALGSEPLR